MGLVLATAASREVPAYGQPGLAAQSTLILLSARPGAGLGNVMFQRKLFPFSPQEGEKAERQANSQGHVLGGRPAYGRLSSLPSPSADAQE